EAPFLKRIDPCDDVAPRTVAGVVPDGALVGVAQVVAAAVIGREDHVSVSSHELRKKAELPGGRSCRPAMNNQYERILAVLLKIRRVEKYAVFLETVRPFPFESLGFAKRQRGDFVIEVGQTPRFVRRGRHVIQLRRLRWRASRKGDIAFGADEGIHPE